MSANWRRQLFPPRARAVDDRPGWTQSGFGGFERPIAITLAGNSGRWTVAAGAGAAIQGETILDVVTAVWERYPEAEHHRLLYERAEYTEDVPPPEKIPRVPIRVTYPDGVEDALSRCRAKWSAVPTDSREREAFLPLIRELADQGLSATDIGWILGAYPTQIDRHAHLDVLEAVARSIGLESAD